MPRTTARLTESVVAEAIAAAGDTYEIHDFAAVEQLIGRPLSGDERFSLISIGSGYFFKRCLEDHRVPLREVTAWLCELKAAATDLRNILKADTPDHLQFLLSEPLNKELRNRPLSWRMSGQITVQNIALLLHDLEKACDRIHAGSACKHQTAWIWLVFELREFAERVGLPATASNRSQGRAGALPGSPFVRFVAVILDTFPAGIGRPIHSLPALAKAVSRALTTLRDIKSLDF